jgi:hypothetical protein
MPTSYESYQAYLRGPTAVICLFKQSPGAQVIYGRPDPNMQQRTIKSLSEEIGDFVCLSSMVS